MATDISLVGNVVQITEGSAQPIAFIQSNGKYFFNQEGTILNLNLGGGNTFAINLTDLRVAGAGSAPVNAAAAYTALSTVFQK